MRKQNLSLQSTFLIKLYQSEENATVGQISEKRCSMLFMFSRWHFKLSFFRKNINNTQVTTELVALT